MIRTIPKALRLPARAIIEPRIGDQYWWEELGTFNPAVATYNNKVILLYRAYDKFRISRLGLAHSGDGTSFQRYPHPIIDTNPDDSFERMGIEDPRITEIDGTYYIIHTSASYYRVGESVDVGRDIDFVPWRIRIGMHSTKDFRNFTHWGVILPDIAAKNACLLPIKINGQFGLYYREHDDEGEILKLSLTSDFRHWSKPAIIHWPQALDWQASKFGTGSQPIITPEGLLMVYHAVDLHRTYRLGLMLFDQNDPTKILWHSNPILEPEMPYEKEGYIPNVVYSCGALIRDNELWIYYGGADQIIGRAVLALDQIF